MSARDDLPIMLFASPLTEWRPWFAWYPVKTWDFGWRWLRWVDCRLMGKKVHLPGPIGEPWFQYRSKEAA